MIKLSAAGRIKAVYSDSLLMFLSPLILLWLVVKLGDLSVCYQRRVNCHHSYPDGVHIRKVKQLLFIVMYRACHQTWG